MQELARAIKCLAHRLSGGARSAGPFSGEAACAGIRWGKRCTCTGPSSRLRCCDTYGRCAHQTREQVHAQLCNAQVCGSDFPL